MIPVTQQRLFHALGRVLMDRPMGRSVALAPHGEVEG
jgi:hypothetical protein